MKIQNFINIHPKKRNLNNMQHDLIINLSELIESRDKGTGEHIRKTACYVEIIVKEMRKKGFYKDQMTNEFCQNIINAAPLHDIGKIHIPENILTKPGKLTDEEFEIIKTHTTLGGKVIDEFIKLMPESSYLMEAKKLALYHHEKWNGKGYPYGLSRNKIPLSARIMAVADVFDALISRRCYKEPMGFEEALNVIRENSKEHFDPLVVDAFLGAEKTIRKIVQKYNDF